MGKHDLKRVVVVSSSAAEPTHHVDGGVLLNRVMQPLITRTVGISTCADMRAMGGSCGPAACSGPSCVRGGLFDAAGMSSYDVSLDRSERVFTSPADLAHSMLAPATDTAWIGKCVAVNTVDGVPTLLQMIGAEAVA